MFPEIFEFWALITLTWLGDRCVTASEYYAFCAPRFSFCLYSEGIAMRNASIDEANKVCKKVSKTGSLANMDYYAETVVIEFVKNFSLTNILLHAKFDKGKWMWLPLKDDVNMKDGMKAEGDYLFYKLKPDDIKFYVACMAACKADWKVKPNLQTDYTQVFVFEANTLEECKELCQPKDDCLGVDWEQRSTQKCGLVLTDEPLKQKPNTRVVHHEMDRSARTIRNCLGEITVKYKKSMVNRILGEKEQYLTKIKNPWVTYLLATISSSVVVMMYYGLTKKKPMDESSEEDD